MTKKSKSCRCKCPKSSRRDRKDDERRRESERKEIEDVLGYYPKQVHPDLEAVAFE